MVGVLLVCFRFTFVSTLDLRLLFTFVKVEVDGLVVLGVLCGFTLLFLDLGLSVLVY